MPRNVSSAHSAPLGVEVGALRHDGVGRRGEVLARRHEEPVVVALRLVDGDERTASGEQAERDDAGDDADDDEHHPAGGPAASLCGRWRLRRDWLGDRLDGASTGVPFSVPPWSSRNGGYSSRMRST